MRRLFHIVWRMLLEDGLRVRKDMRNGEAQEKGYLLTPEIEEGEEDFRRVSVKRRRSLLSPSRCPVVVPMLCVVCVILTLVHFAPRSQSQLPLHPSGCDNPEKGYQCQPEISHSWGQYSPFYAVDSDIDPVIPPDCNVTFVQVLSRHGARFPTRPKTDAYRATVERIQKQAKHLEGKYAFLADFDYDLGADDLTDFGRQEMYNSGFAFYDRYRDLVRQMTPFIRASRQDRVVESAQKFSQGLHEAKLRDQVSDGDYPYPILTISESPGSNNTLDHNLCTSFESSPRYTSIASAAQATFLSTFLPPITARLSQSLGVNLSVSDTVSLLDLCPYTIVSSLDPSPFCALFSTADFISYDYYQSLGKYYGFGPGNPLGPTQGVGFVNELIARLTSSPVKDTTSVNRTLDSESSTFPLDSHAYVDVSHDNDMTSIFSALELFNDVEPLPNTTIPLPGTPEYSAAQTVPFAGRAYIEKMQCPGDSSEELVRVIINSRVHPLPSCSGDSLGRCALKAFLASLRFAREGGKWEKCFQDEEKIAKPEVD
ncbi:MAG: hypothetical protein Q9190_007433 [Brigantiaea leucoxantha]